MAGSSGKILHLSNRFSAAVDYARILHVEQRKGSQVPYMAHLLGVVSLVMGEHGVAGVTVSEDMVIAALLHDAAEDHGGIHRLLDIEQNFGARVAQMVEGLSDSLAENAQEKELWEDRKSAYLRRLENESAEVQLISVADKVHNARTILEDYRVYDATLWKRFKRGRDQQLWYLKELLKIYRAGVKGRLTDEFERLITELSHTTK